MGGCGGAIGAVRGGDTTAFSRPPLFADLADFPVNLLDFKVSGA